MLNGLKVPGVGTVNGASLTGSEALRRYATTNIWIANGEVGALANFINNTNAFGGARGQLLRNAGLSENFIVVNPQFGSVTLHGNERHGSSCWLRVQRLSLELMADRRWIIRSYGASVAALLLVTAIGSTLLHWHSDWNDQRCQLCHVRHLPSVFGPVAEGPVCPVLTERDWLADNPAYELESFFVRFSSRAPPRSTSFTVS